MDESERRSQFDTAFEHLKAEVAALPDSEDPEVRENLWRAIRLRVAKIERLYPS